jgi:small subunit ribosomal protein S8
MSMTDPIADMLTRIRNAYAVRKDSVDMPLSQVKREIAAVMKREGFIADVETIPNPPQGTLRVFFKYGPDGERIFNKIRRISKPGQRVYNNVAKMKPVLKGMGIHILSTNKGIMSDREARKANVGGELICTIW